MTATHSQASGLGQSSASAPSKVATGTEQQSGSTAHAVRPHASARTLLVAATGGHLTQLTRLAPRLEMRGEPLWVTFDTPQSRALLAGQEVEFVRVTRPRDLRNVVLNTASARRILREHEVAEVVSTGSAVALAFLPVARVQGIPCHYIESAARSTGPSITGRALRYTPGTRLYTQYGTWASRRWHLAGSVFDEFVPFTTYEPVEGRRLKVLVTLGTMDYRFDRLVDAVRAATLPEWDVTWQVGPNAYDRLPGRVVEMLDADAFARECREADVVVAHAGVGASITALEGGCQPLLLPRRRDRGEHVDDHQELIAAELTRRGIAQWLEPEQLSPAWLQISANRRVERSIAPATITLARE